MTIGYIIAGLAAIAGIVLVVKSVEEIVEAPAFPLLGIALAVGAFALYAKTK